MGLVPINLTVSPVIPVVNGEVIDSLASLNVSVLSVALYLMPLFSSPITCSSVMA